MGPALHMQNHGPSFQIRTYHPRPNVLTVVVMVVSFVGVCGQGNKEAFTCYSELQFLLVSSLLNFAHFAHVLLEKCIPIQKIDQCTHLFLVSFLP